MLPQCYAPMLQQLLEEDAGFLDAALQLRQEGSACLAQQVLHLPPGIRVKVLSHS